MTGVFQGVIFTGDWILHTALSHITGVSHAKGKENMG
jgi:hypothetical protein